MTDKEIVDQLNAFYDHATGPEGLGQYEDENGDVGERQWDYDHHLGDIEMDAFELLGVLLAQREES